MLGMPFIQGMHFRQKLHTWRCAKNIGSKKSKKIFYAKSIQNALKRMQNKYERNPMKNEVARAI